MQQDVVTDEMSGLGFTRRATVARMGAQARLRKWAGFDHDNYKLLKKLMGMEVDASFVRSMTEEHIRVCELLCGPHGYVIYRMLLIKRGLEQ